MRQQAEQMLDDLREQIAYFQEQLVLARGAYQAIEHLLAVSQDDTNDVQNDD